MKKIVLPLFALAFAVTAPPVVAQPSTAVSVQTVKLETLAQTATAYGQLVPNPRALRWSSAALAGRVATVFVTAGTTVKKGEKLVRIAPTPQSLATLEVAKSSLAAARAKLQQTETLARNSLATKADLAAAKSAKATAAARLKALTSGDIGVHGEVLKATQAGVVTQLLVTPGQWVAAGARIAALAPAGALWVRLGLTPKQAAHVQPGTRVRLVPVFGTDHATMGQVARVAGQANPKTGLVDAEVPVSAKGSGLFPGEWVTAAITLRSEQLPVVPRSAVLKDAHGFYVFVVRSGVAHRVTIKPQIRAAGQVGVAGLRPGATVVTQGNFELREGAAVRIEKRPGSGS